MKKTCKMTDSTDKKQLLHLVFGGELESLEDVQFRDLNGLDIVGIFPDYASALSAWKAKAQATVDKALPPGRSNTLLCGNCVGAARFVAVRG